MGLPWPRACPRWADSHLLVGLWRDLHRAPWATFGEKVGGWVRARCDVSGCLFLTSKVGSLQQIHRPSKGNSKEENAPGGRLSEPRGPGKVGPEPRGCEVFSEKLWLGPEKEGAPHSAKWVLKVAGAESSEQLCHQRGPWLRPKQGDFPGQSRKHREA